jgi:ATP-dependent Clp protease adapter protein ClpS
MFVSFSQNLERTLQHAASVAGGQGRERAAPEDLLIALIDDEEASNVMRALFIDPERLRRDIAAYMEGAIDEAGGNVSAAPNYTADLHRILQLAVVQVQSSERQVVTGADLLVELFTEPVGHLLQQQGATRYDAVSYLSHGGTVDAGPTRPAATSDAASPERDVNDISAGDSPDLEVFLLNDEYTPMEFVVWVLQEVFGLGHEDAMRVMLSTHNQGRGTCGVFGRAEAAELAERVAKLAREHQHPLSCMMRPALNPSASPPAATPDR